MNTQLSHLQRISAVEEQFDRDTGRLYTADERVTQLLLQVRDLRATNRQLRDALTEREAVIAGPRDALAQANAHITELQKLLAESRPANDSLAERAESESGVSGVAPTGGARAS